MLFHDSFVLEEIADEAANAGSSLQLRVSCILERLPVILPDLKPWEIEYLELKQRRAVFKNKQYPTNALRMNVQKDILKDQETKSSEKEEEELPHNVDPWVYRLLARGTTTLGPFQQFKDLDKRLKQMETGSHSKKA